MAGRVGRSKDILFFWTTFRTFEKMKQQTQVPPFYPPRASVGDFLNWDDPTYKPCFFEDGVLHKMPIPGWACCSTVGKDIRGARPTFHTPTRELKPLSQSSVLFDYNCNMWRNPRGKTGLIGRGVLGWFGPNHAADNIVTREHGAHFQVLLVEKHQNDGAALAFPAGMVEPGMDVVTTLKKELIEEAVAAGDAVDELFQTCKQKVVYSGLVDDYRNTDWAWIETTAVWFHATGAVADALELRVKDEDEIRGVRWVNIEEVTAMYASHIDWLNIVKDELRQRFPFVSHAQPHLVTNWVSHASDTLAAAAQDVSDNACEPEAKRVKCDKVHAVM